MRSTRPAAATSLPSLLANATTPPTYTHGNQNGHSNGVRGQMRGNGHANEKMNGYVPMPVTQPAIPAAINEDGSRPILPPRPTGRMMTASTSEPGWIARNWPLLVIATACLAIFVALLFMVMPMFNKNKDQGTKADKLTPAPERMDTNPLVPKDPRSGGGTTPDPWKDPNGGVKPDKPDIDIPDDPDVDDPGSGGATGPTLQGTGAIMMGMVRHVCDRAQSCGQLDAKLVDYCTETKKYPIAPPPASCPAAQRCFTHIDQMSCSASFDDISALTSVMHKFQDCVEALQCS